MEWNLVPEKKVGSVAKKSPNWHDISPTTLWREPETAIDHTHTHIKSSKHVVGVIGCPISSGYVHGMLSLEQRGGLQQKRLLLGVGLLQWPKDTPNPW